MYMLSMIYVPRDRVASKSVPKVQREIEKKSVPKVPRKIEKKSVPKVQREMEMCINVQS